MRFVISHFVLVLLLGWGIFLPAQDFSSLVFKYTDLLLWQSSARLTPFRFTGNPAGILQHYPQNQTWLEGTIRGFDGELHRNYDAAAGNWMQVTLASVQHLSPKQSLYGKIEYNLENRKSVPYALEPSPYDDDPQIIADTTVGDFFYQGPRVEVAYAVGGNRWTFGALLYYQLFDGAKRRYSFARILRRRVVPGVGALFRISEKWQLGGWLHYEDVKDRIELTRDILTGEDVLVRLYRSEKVYRVKVGEFTHERDKRTLQVQGSLFQVAEPGHLVQAFTMAYASPRQALTNYTTVSEKDAGWFATQWSTRYEIRWRSRDGQWRLGARLGTDYLSSFSRHPHLDVLFTERSRWYTKAEFGGGIRMTGKFPFSGMVQIGYYPIRDKYDDYQSQIFRNIRGQVYRVALAFELETGKNWQWVLTGSHTRQHLSEESPRYLPDYRKWNFALGFQTVLGNIRMGVLGEYFWQDAISGFLENRGGSVKLIFTGK